YYCIHCCLVLYFILFPYSTLFRSKSVIYSIMIIDILSNIFIILTVVVVITGIIFKIFHKKLNIEQILRISQKIPLYKHLLKLQTSYYLTLQMSMFLKTGLS